VIGSAEFQHPAVERDRAGSKPQCSAAAQDQRAGIEVSAPALTEKNIENVKQAGSLGVDYIALSFVRRPEDIEQLRALVPRGVKLVAKIEKDTAITNLCGILDSSDAIMVARGDLGVELPFEEVPLIQKQIIREASLHGKPVITATQMLESMVHAPRPTRAETSDVANAILDGTDAVMLSAETAVGDYPLEAVQAMDRIAREMESQRQSRGASIDAALGRRSAEQGALRHHQSAPGGPIRTEDAIAVAVCAAAEMLSAPLIVCFTSSGFTARKVATCRPTVPVFACTPEPETFRQLALVWGVTPVLTAHSNDYDRMLKAARQGADAKGAALYLDGHPEDRPAYTDGTWDGQAELVVHLRAGDRELGRMLLTERRHGLPYAPRERDQIQRAADVVAVGLALASQKTPIAVPG